MTYVSENMRPSGNTRTPQQVMAQQAADAAKASGLPAPVTTKAVAVPDNRSAVMQYLDETAPQSIVGRLIKFDGKKGAFVTTDNGEAIDQSAEFIALCEELWIGWIKFMEDAPPEKVGGLLYDGYVLPPRNSLGDTDQSAWPAGVTGQPSDPWQHQQMLPLQHTDTRELFTYSTTSSTGRRAVANLLRAYERLRRADPNELPVIRLKVGGFNHRDARIGWVHAPVLAQVGRTSRDNAAKPDTSVGADLNDAVPF
jgi:hypothetical protein